jgi:hypothetical protein
MVKKKSGTKPTDSLKSKTKTRTRSILILCLHFKYNNFFYPRVNKKLFLKLFLRFTYFLKKFTCRFDPFISEQIGYTLEIILGCRRL